MRREFQGLVDKDTFNYTTFNDTFSETFNDTFNDTFNNAFNDTFSHSFDVVAILSAGRKSIIAITWVFTWKTNYLGASSGGRYMCYTWNFGARRSRFPRYFLALVTHPCHSSTRMTATIRALERDRTLNRWSIEHAFVQSRIGRDICVRLLEGCGSMSGKTS